MIVQVLLPVFAALFSFGTIILLKLSSDLPADYAFFSALGTGLCALASVILMAIKRNSKATEPLESRSQILLLDNADCTALMNRLNVLLAAASERVHKIAEYPY